MLVRVVGDSANIDPAVTYHYGYKRPRLTSAGYYGFEILPSSSGDEYEGCYFGLSDPTLSNAIKSLGINLVGQAYEGDPTLDVLDAMVYEPPLECNLNDH